MAMLPDEADFERHLESLDQEAHALHQSQARIFREQLGAFIHDLEVVRQEVLAVASQSAIILGRVSDTCEAQAGLDRMHKESVERILSLEQSVHDLVERHGRQESRIEASHQQSAEDRGALQAHALEVQAAVEKRLAIAESLLGHSADQRSTRLQAIEEAHAAHAERLASLSAAQARHHDLEERVDRIERWAQSALGDPAQGTAEAAAGSRLERLESSLEALGKCQAALAAELAGQAEELTSVRAAQAAVPERLRDLEQHLGEARERQGDSASCFRRELAHLHAAASKQEAALARVSKDEEARLLVQSSMAERLTRLETRTEDIFDRIGRHLSVAKGMQVSDHDQILGAYRRHAAQVMETLPGELPLKTALPEKPCGAYPSMQRTAPPLQCGSPPPKPSCLDMVSLSLGSRPCPRSPRTARSTSPRSPCDWGEAVKRMQAEGLVSAEVAQGESADSYKAPAEWPRQPRIGNRWNVR